MTHDQYCFLVEKYVIDLLKSDNQAIQRLSASIVTLYLEMNAIPEGSEEKIESFLESTLSEASDRVVEGLRMAGMLGIIQKVVTLIDQDFLRPLVLKVLAAVSASLPISKTCILAMSKVVEFIESDPEFVLVFVGNVVINSKAAKICNDNLDALVKQTRSTTKTTRRAMEIIRRTVDHGAVSEENIKLVLGVIQSAWKSESHDLVVSMIEGIARTGYGKKILQSSSIVDRLLEEAEKLENGVKVRHKYMKILAMLDASY